MVISGEYKYKIQTKQNKIKRNKQIFFIDDTNKLELYLLFEIDEYAIIE